MPNIGRVVMKKILAICLGAAIAITATGCGDKVTLTEEQNDLIAEYVAGVMLKHSYDNEWNYQKLDIAKNTYNSKGSINNSAATNNTVGSTQASTVISQPAAQSQTTQQTASSKSGKVAASGDVITDMKKAMELRNADLAYSTYVVGERYPTDEFAICVPASEGCKVIAVEFTITNNTGDTIEANTGSSGINFALNVNGTTIKQLTSILKNDISALSKVSIPSGSGYTAVALFQVTDSLADNITSMNLEVFSNSVSLGNINLK